ncbi:FKBP12-interacting protein of 37 kDa [Irineochytrium annulatum]|nr:FKBP12-interacting protein of 37 kDa [Irineochytrium annulatum]
MEVDSMGELQRLRNENALLRSELEVCPHLFSRVDTSRRDPVPGPSFWLDLMNDPPQTKQNDHTDLLSKLLKKDREVNEIRETLRSIEAVSRPMFVDPIVVERMRAMGREMQEKNERIKRLEEEMKGVQFSVESLLGKQLIERLRKLEAENEELGRYLSRSHVEQLRVEVQFLRNKLAVMELRCDGCREEYDAAHAAGSLEKHMAAMKED